MRRATVLAAFFAPSVLFLGTVPVPMLFGQKAAIPSLAGSYRAFFPIGAAVDGNTIISQSDLLTSQVNSVVAENDMKWDIIHPRPGNDASSYDFSRADSIVAFAGSNGMTVRGHNFVWHQQVPAWVFQGDGMGAGQASKTEVLARMKGHIETLLAHFHGKVYCWDVVNEALSDGFETWRSDSPWFRAAGSDEDGDGVPDYIVKAFQFARQADPAVKLFYNDYGIESGAKREKAYALARLLKDKGLIDGVGIQGHWSIYSPDAETVRAGIRRIASLGLEVQITELDLSAYGQGDSSALGGLPPRLEDMQAARYGELFRVFREESGSRGLSAVTFWGIADDHTWLDNFPVKGRKDWPLLFDAANGPKKAFWSVAQW